MDEPAWMCHDILGHTQTPISSCFKSIQAALALYLFCRTSQAAYCQKFCFCHWPHGMFSDSRFFLVSDSRVFVSDSLLLIRSKFLSQSLFNKTKKHLQLPSAYLELPFAFLVAGEKQMGQRAKQTKGNYSCCLLILGRYLLLLVVWETQMGQLALNKQKATTTAISLFEIAICFLSWLGQGNGPTGFKQTKRNCNCYLPNLGCPSAVVWDTSRKEKTNGNYNCYPLILGCYLFFFVFFGKTWKSKWANLLLKKVRRSEPTLALKKLRLSHPAAEPDPWRHQTLHRPARCFEYPGPASSDWNPGASPRVRGPGQKCGLKKPSAFMEEKKTCP